MSLRIKLFSLLTIGLTSLGLSACAAESLAERFVIASANLDGSKYKVILKDSTHNLTHPRVSPNGERITFTKYFHQNAQGLCIEEDGYFDTEIVVSNIDGTKLRTVVSHKPGIIAANSSWVDDNHIIYIHCQPPNSPEIRCIDVDSGTEKKLVTPSKVMPSDPHIQNNKFVFGTIDFHNKTPNAIWISNTDGTAARQISHPPQIDKIKGNFNFGDYDPRLSPDGKKVAFMRHFGGEDWRTYIIDLSKENSSEIEIGGKGVWITPDWTPDGRQLVCFYINRADLKNSGLWLMKPDGSDKQQIKLPRKYLFHNPNTYTDKEKNEIRVIFGAKYNAGML